MKVSPITNNNLSHKGYVDKSIKRYVKQAVTKSCNDIVNDSNAQSLEVDIAELKNVMDKGTAILENLNNFMAKLHKNTRMYLSNDYIEIDNPISKERSIGIRGSALDNNKIIGDYIFINEVKNSTFNKHNQIDGLHRLEKISQHLSEIKTEDIDKTILAFGRYNAIKKAKEYGTEFFGRYIANKQAKAVKQYADEIGAKSNIINEVENSILEAKEDNKVKKLARKKQKELVERNSKIAKDFMKI